MSCGGYCRDCGSDRHVGDYQISCRKCYTSFCGPCGNVCLECNKNFVCSCEKSQICVECVLTFLLNKTGLTQEQVFTEITEMRKNK